MKLAKIFLFLALMVMLSFSVSATTDVPGDDYDLSGQYCNWLDESWIDNFIDNLQYIFLTDRCELFSQWVCVKSDGSVVTAPLQPGESASWAPMDTEKRVALCGNPAYVEVLRDLNCCCYGTMGEYHNAKTPAEVTDDKIEEVTAGKVYVYRKSEVMDWASSVGLNMPKSYPFLTLASTPVDPIDMCEITNLDDYPPWSSTDNKNYGCYNIVQCKDTTLETHHTMILTEPDGTFLDGEQRDVCVCHAATPIFRTLLIMVTKDRVNVPGILKRFNGSQLDVIEPELIDWTGIDQAIYPFAFISDETWEINVSLYVPDGLQVVSTNPIQTIVAGDPKIIQFQVVETVEGGGDAGAAVLLNLGHAGKEQQDVSVISAAAVKDIGEAQAKINVKPLEGSNQESDAQIPNVRDVPGNDFLLIAVVALLVIIAIALYMSWMKKN